MKNYKSGAGSESGTNFSASLSARVAGVADALKSALGEAAWRPAGTRLAIEAHQLATVCRANRLERVAVAADALASMLQQTLPHNKALTDDQKQRLRALYDAVRAAAEQPAAGAPSAEAAPDEANGMAGEPAAASSNLIYVLCREADPLRDQIGQLSGFGYSTRLFAQMHEVLDAAWQEPPAGVVVDWDYASANRADLEQLARGLQTVRARRVPLVYLSSDNSLEGRLSAVRMAGEAFFVKPVDLIRLVDRLDALAGARENDPYRVLIIDDSKVQAAHFARLLADGGIMTRIVTNPAESLQQMADFHPDLILMDMYMPGCSGRELASVIRQMEQSDSTPIIFLSAETNPERQLEAMKHLGDGFIPKNIDAKHLLSTVLTRVERSRTLRSFMLRDSLTGLLNHIATKRRLEYELQRASRYGHPLSFVMIDIDHFKKVNDTYGHAAGDTVIKSLARHLQHQLRATDVIGRYGGEEFAVIMPETGSADAQRIVDRIRDGFAQMTHTSEGRDIAVTFSAGVCAYPDKDGSMSLSKAADDALYEAKRNGRNAVVVAHPVSTV